MAGLTLGIELFDPYGRNQNFNVWLVSVQKSLRAAGLYHIVASDVNGQLRYDPAVDPSTLKVALSSSERAMSDSEDGRRVRTALYYSLSGTAQTVVSYDTKYPRRMIARLKQKYGRYGESPAYFLHKKFMSLKYSGETAEVYVQRFLELRDELSKCIYNEEDYAVATFLGSVEEHFPDLVDSLYSTCTNRLTLQQVSTMVVEEYKKKGAIKMTSTSLQNSSTRAGTSTGNSSNSQNGYGARRDRDSPGQNGSYNLNGSSTREGRADDEFLIGSIGLAEAQPRNLDDRHGYLIDATATNNMCHDRKLLQNVTRIPPIPIQLPDKRMVLASEKGSLGWKAPSGVSVSLGETLYVPELKHTVLSVGQMSQADVTTILSKKGGELRYKGDCIAVLNKFDNKFWMEPQQDSGTLPDADHVTQVQTWHRRLAHLNRETVEKLVNVRQLPLVKRESIDCVACVQWSPVAPKLNWHCVAEEPGERLLVDVSGPFKESLGGAKYCLLVMDEYSRYVFIKTIPEKDDAVDALQDIIMEIESHDLDVSSVVATNDSDFNDIRFWLELNNIHYEGEDFLSSTTQNFETWARRTCAQLIRKLLLSANLPTEFWGEALVSSWDVRNHIPEVGQTFSPKEILFRVRSNVSAARPFGCHVVYHTGSKNKLSRRSANGILLNVLPKNGKYKVLKADGFATATSRVRFSEDKFPGWPLNQTILIV